MVRCENCEMETFRTRIQLEEDGCPWCGVVGMVRVEPEPRIVVAQPSVRKIVTPRFEAIMSALEASHWFGVRDELDKASHALGERRYSDACNNLRMALVTVWSKVVERLTGRSVGMDQSGKTVDIKPLVNRLRDMGVPDDTAGLVSRTWGFLSERSHIEKKDAAQPSVTETFYGYQLGLAAIDLLLRLNQQAMPSISSE